MKAYCENCESLQPYKFRSGQDAVTLEPYEDLCCNTCHLILDTFQDRDTTPPAAPMQEPKFVRMVEGVPCITLAEHKHLMAAKEKNT